MVDQIITAGTPLNTTTTTSLTAKYAGFWRRFAAAILDSLIVSLGSQVVNILANIGSNEIAISIGSIAGLILSLAYYIYFIGEKGQTPGKMVLKIKVMRADGNGRIGYGKAFMREVVGKLVSSLVFGLGYLWMIWDGKKQTWQDKIAGTVVVKV